MKEQLRHDQEPATERLIRADRVLYLTRNPDLIKYQIAGGQLSDVSQDALLDKISTDEIIPNRACLAYTGKEEGHLGNYVLTGLRGGIIKPGEVVTGHFDVIVAGPSFGRGSSRIHASIALQEAGISLVIAESERIFTENCINSGIYILNPQSEQAIKLLEGKPLTENEVISNLSTMQQGIMKSGGLLLYLAAIEERKLPLPEVQPSARPMTIAEKIIARKTMNRDGSVGKVAVKPGDEVVTIPDQYYGYELQSGPMRKALQDMFGGNIRVKHPGKVRLYNDHTALLHDKASETQRRQQTLFAIPLGIIVYEADNVRGVPAICHTDMVENHALPGQLILGNDSHTDTLGVLNNLAVGKGAFDLAGAIAYDQMVITVPESIRITLAGRLGDGVTMKDFMLQLGARPEFKKDHIASWRIIEFRGEALKDIPFEEQLKLTNMAIELQAFSGIVEPNRQIVSYLMKKRGMTEYEIEQMFVRSDDNAKYAFTLNVDLSTVEPTVAEPGDTQNGKPLSEIRKQEVRVNKAYIGSCTHGTAEDLKQAADVIRGYKVADGVMLYVQASSIGNLEEAQIQGYIQDLIDAGAELLPIGCGACMNAGPGSTEEGEVGIFATNRNFPNRTGMGKTYLSSPAIVAASAIRGFICGPEDLN